MAFKNDQEITTHYLLLCNKIENPFADHVFYFYQTHGLSQSIEIKCRINNSCTIILLASTNRPTHLKSEIYLRSLDH